MSKSVERELKLIDSRMLYQPKRNVNTEPVLLNAVRTTELIEPPPTINQPQDQTAASPDDHESPDSSNPNVEIRTEEDSATKPKQENTAQKNDVPANSVEGEESFPRTAPMSIPPSLLSNQQQSGNTEENGHSVVVNISPRGSTVQEKKHLSQILHDVQMMRKLRRRNDSFSTEGSYDAKMERTKENISRRLDKMKQSKRLLFKYQVYEFFKRPSTFWATIYHVLAFLLVMACLIVSLFPQVDSPYLDDMGGKWNVLDHLEKIVVIWFSIEYLLRLWSCNCRPKYCGLRGKWNFVKAPAHLIDLLVIILSVWVMVWPHEGHEVFAFRAFRGFHRFFQVAQIMITERQLRPWRIFMSVLYDQREQLMIIFYMEIIIFSLLAYLGFLVEHQSNDMLDSMAEAVWWSIVTMTTVGYGDKVPISWRGKTISAIFILFGFCMFALPAGIIGAGLALKLEQVEQRRQRRRKVEAAARVIQRAWHCHNDISSYQKLTSFFTQQTGDHYKSRVLENISHAFISLVRFQVAKNQFKELARTPNLRNVIESYKYGQMDVFARLKHLDDNLDKIMNRMAKAEIERFEAIKRLTNHLQLPDGSTPSASSDTFIQTNEGSFLINTVSGCFNENLPFDSTKSQYTDLIFLPRKNLQQQPRRLAMDSGSMRTRSLVNPVSSTDRDSTIPFIDGWTESAKSTSKATINDDGHQKPELRRRRLSSSSSTASTSSSKQDNRRHSK
ncbi:potassium voltage-gated channel subfamily KQT-like protein [Euroglyphus maynei]|uniref:Potassium voltage-gated channel subfamily KQT-like protein n=1 Tax=Euroglyphus maynei TaxID=6958 RepID=A0A1Y3AQT9_EURMA|nr:potassium voltage-gated channel subfamily KQT-like protein [Euroglyphus maynei]